MAWTPDADYDSINRRLKADPRYQQAYQLFSQTIRANPVPTTAQQRAGDDGGAAADQARLIKIEAGRKLGSAVMPLLREYGISDFDRLGISADTGQVHYEAPDHSGRNMILAFGAIAGAGLASGLMGGGAAAGGGAGAMAAVGPSTAANMAATSAVVGGSTVPASLAAGGAGVAHALNYTDLIGRYVLPTAGGLVNGLLQRGDENDRFAAQQKYLEDALAYAKEKDAYDRQRTEGLDAQERTRYAGYQGRMDPFIKTGTSANARMAALLGLNPQGAA
jgi:hypothetical protein